MRRRELLGGMALAAVMPARVLAAADGDAALGALLARHAGELKDPDTLGAIPDRSAAGRARATADNARRLAELRAIDRASLSPKGTIDYDTALFVYTTFDDLSRRYGHVDLNLRPNAYVVTQMSGQYYWLPDNIGARSPMKSAADADRYIAQLEGFARAVDDENQQIAHDAGLGVVPPTFVLAKTIAQLKALRDAPLAENSLTQSAVQRARAGGLSGVEARAAAALKDKAVPALDRQIAALTALQPRATDVAGVWHLPNGEDYYAAACRANTTTKLTPAELHEIGLDLVARLSAETDAALRAQGMTSGSVAERIIALGKDPRFALPEDDSGRAQVIAAAEKQIAKVKSHLPRGFTHIPDDPILVRRIPPAIDAGGPGAYYSDGGASQPGVFYVNLHTVAETPLWRLKTLVHHEGIPGHHFQFSVLRHAPALSPFRRVVRFSAYTEGWAHYAERLADEIGVYDDDPLGRIGMLQAQLFRACRIAVDTGIHYKRWTRDQATDWMVAHGGEARSYAEREIDRYCVFPGQACSFKIGQERIHAAREKARARLGSRFSLQRYNDLVLAGGPLPLDVLDAVVERWDGGAV